MIKEPRWKVDSEWVKKSQANTRVIRQKHLEKVVIIVVYADDLQVLTATKQVEHQTPEDV